MVVKVVVTGAAGFIGSHLSKALLEKGYYVIAIDSMNPYYDIRLKQTHLNQIKALPQAADHFRYHQLDINEPGRCEKILDEEKPTVIVHLAAQAGVRYCQAHPDEAENNNIKTTRLLLDLAHRSGSSIKQFLFASSSSIYGTHPRPWKETYVTKPEGIYGESKAKGEEMCKEIFQPNRISIAAMRFFTVYGPFGRPDMAPGKFMDIIHRGKVVPVYGDGSAIRDFTFVEDIVQGIVLIIENPNFESFEIYNLGKGTETPNSVLDLIKSIETHLHKKANVLFTDPMAGDVPATQADITKAQNAFGYKPLYTLEDGIKKTVSIFLQNIIKFPVVLLVTKDNSEILSRQLKTLQSQSKQPEMIIVLDQSEDKNFIKNQEILKGIDAVKHIQVLQEGINDVWMAGFSFLEEQLEAKEIESFEEASNVFVSLVYDDLTWTSSDLSNMIDYVSKGGYEYIETPRSHFIRLDVLLANKGELNPADTHLQFLSSLQNVIKGADNLRVHIE